MLSGLRLMNICMERLFMAQLKLVKKLVSHNLNNIDIGSWSCEISYKFQQLRKK
ncbi:hypothetical protein D3C75_1260890 [compost metagenome]